MNIATLLAGGRTRLGSHFFELLVGVGLAVLLFDLLRRLVTDTLRVFDLFLFVKEGIVLGLVIGLAGIGLALTYSILHFPNFAHGDYITMGAFAGWVVSYVIAGLGSFDLRDLFLIGVRGDAGGVAVGTSVVQTPVAIVTGLLVAIAFTILATILIDRVVYRPMRDEGVITLLITSVGVALILRYSIAFVWGQETTTLTANSRPQFTAPGIGVQVSTHELTLVACTLVLIAGIHYLIQQTKLGTAMRAMADNPDLAAITGIPTERVVLATWIIAGGATGAAGYLVGLETGILAFNTGWTLLLLIFAAVILGGVGSIYGAIFGGLVIGIVSNVALVWIPSDFTTAAAFLVMIAVLLVKPKGLFEGVTTA